MKLKNIISVLGVMLFAGCSSVTTQPAMVADGFIKNASLGFSGFTFEIPQGFEMYNPAAKNPAEYNELQRMAIRMYDLNKVWHPRDDELFYEGFLFMSDKACFLLMTLKYSYIPRNESSPFSDRSVSQWQFMPLYNVTATRSFELGANRMPAVYTRGYAYEQKGWYYDSPKNNRMPFNYEACKVTGDNRDRYILMGFALPEHAEALTAPMKQMIDGLLL
jgi:hypothetical protein